MGAASCCGNGSDAAKSAETASAVALQQDLKSQHINYCVPQFLISECINNNIVTMIVSKEPYGPNLHDGDDYLADGPMESCTSKQNLREIEKPSTTKAESEGTIAGQVVLRMQREESEARGRNIPREGPGTVQDRIEDRPWDPQTTKFIAG
eukprot:6479047-Amphidinium_carterae.1